MGFTDQTVYKTNPLPFALDRSPKRWGYCRGRITCPDDIHALEAWQKYANEVGHSLKLEAFQSELKLLQDNLISISNQDSQNRIIREVLFEKFRANRWTELKFNIIFKEIGAPADLADTRDAYSLFTKVSE